MQKQSPMYVLLAVIVVLLVGVIALQLRSTTATTTTTPYVSEQDAHTEKLRQDAREAAATAKLVDDAHTKSEEEIEEVRRKTAQHISALKWARGETPTSQESRDAVGIKRD